MLTAQKIMRQLCVAVSLGALLCVAATGHAQEIAGIVVHVADGDTITVLTESKIQHTVRLYGIDCPERRQAFGNVATRTTRELCATQRVTVRVMDTDRYGRVVGIVTLPDGSILQEHLLREGLAWVYTRYCRARTPCNEWQRIEEAAKAQRRGLWTDEDPVPPWQWRRKKAAEAHRPVEGIAKR